LSQKPLSGGFDEPQFGHIISRSNEVPHFLQNKAPSRFSNWHFGHFILKHSQMNQRRANWRSPYWLSKGSIDNSDIV
jgi:hypothetical protein